MLIKTVLLSSSPQLAGAASVYADRFLETQRWLSRLSGRRPSLTQTWKQITSTCAFPESIYLPGGLSSAFLTLCLADRCSPEKHRWRLSVSKFE